MGGRVTLALRTYQILGAWREIFERAACGSENICSKKGRLLGEGQQLREGAQLCFSEGQNAALLVRPTH